MIDAPEQLQSFIDAGKDVGEVLKIKKGFPPKPLDLSNIDTVLQSIGIKAEENLIVEISAEAKGLFDGSSGKAEASGAAQDGEKGAVKDIITDSGYTQLKVPSDGSCLFNSITLALEDRIDK